MFRITIYLYVNTTDDVSLAALFNYVEIKVSFIADSVRVITAVL